MTWTMPDDAAASLTARLAGRAAAGTYRAQLPGRPARVVSYLTDGTAWRATIGEYLVWLDGPAGTWWDDQPPTGTPYRVAAGAGAVLTHPLPELHALESAADAAAYVDRGLDPGPGTALTHPATGRAAHERTGPGLRLTVDDATGMPLALRADLAHGASLALDVLAFALTDPDPEQFTYAGPTRPGTHFAGDYADPDER